LNFAVADTRGANPNPLVRALYHRVNTLQVQIPAPLRHVVRVTDFIAELRTAAAHITNFRHETRLPRAVGTQTKILARHIKVSGSLFRSSEPLVNFVNGRDFKENVSKSWVKWV
jgi:hypothetical protein